MKKLFLFLLFCHVSAAVKHSLSFFATGSSGIPNFPEFMATVEVDNTVVGSCDTMKNKLEMKQDWIKNMFEKEPQHLQWCKVMCFEYQPKLFKDRINHLMQGFNQTGGVHIFQMIYGCEWDNETGEVSGVIQYGYDGEDILSFDPKTQTWIALKPEAETIKRGFETNIKRIIEDVVILTQLLPGFLKKYVALANSSLLLTALDSNSEQQNLRPE